MTYLNNNMEDQKMDTRKLDLVFFKCCEQGISVTYQEIYTIANQNSAKELYKAYSRVVRMKRRGLI